MDVAVMETVDEMAEWRIEQRSESKQLLDLVHQWVRVIRDIPAPSIDSVPSMDNWKIGKQLLEIEFAKIQAHYQSHRQELKSWLAVEGTRPYFLLLTEAVLREGMMCEKNGLILTLAAHKYISWVQPSLIRMYVYTDDLIDAKEDPELQIHVRTLEEFGYKVKFKHMPSMRETESKK